MTKALGFGLAVAWLLGTASCSDSLNPVRAGQGNPVASTTLSHDRAISGVKHASNFCRPVENCSACHGANLQGGSHGEPSCTKCHSDRWNRSDCGHTSHGISLKGVNHRPNYCQPFENCVACHGRALEGGTSGEPACTKCHGEWWKRASCGKNIHTVSLGGVSHAPNYCSPYQNCAECHGSDLHGGPYGEPSCLKCHSQKKWQNCGGAQHNQRKDGVYHAMNYCLPLDNCVQCHGSNLRGGPNNEPSCYRCHGEKWKESDCGR